MKSPPFITCSIRMFGPVLGGALVLARPFSTSAPTTAVLFAFLLLGVVFGRVQTSVAASRQWTGQDSGQWSDPDNWFPAGVPQDGDSLTFPTVGPFDATSMLNDLTGLTVSTMTFTAGGYALNGNPLTLSVGITDNHAGALNIVRCDLQFSGVRGRFNSLSTGLLEINGRVTLVNAQELIVTPVVTNLTISGPILGNGSLTKRDDGTLYLRGSADNTYTGETRVEGGALQLAKTSGARAISSVVTIDGTFIGNASMRDELPGQYPPQMSMVIVSRGVWGLTNGATVTNLVLSESQILGGSLLNLECDVVAAGICPILPAINLGRQVRRFVVSHTETAAGTLDLLGNVLTPIGSSAAGVIKEGPGALTFYGQNSYVGPTLVKEGRLWFLRATGLGAADPGSETRVQGGTLRVSGLGCPEPILVESPDAVLEFAGSAMLTGRLTLSESCRVSGLNSIGGPDRLEIAGGIDGPGGLKISQGSVRLSGSEANTFQGDVNVLGFTSLSSPVTLELAKSDNVEAVPGRVRLAGNGGAELRNFQDGGVNEVIIEGTCRWQLLDHVVAPRRLEILGLGDVVDTGTGGSLQFTNGAFLVNSNRSGIAANFLGNISFLGPTTELRLVQGSVTRFSALRNGAGAVLQKALFNGEAGGTLELPSGSFHAGSFTVNAGTLIVSHPLALGNPAGGTFVTGDGSLVLNGNIDVLDETLTLDSTNPAALVSLGPFPNSWSGPIRLQRTAGIRVDSPSGTLNIAGAGTLGTVININGPGGLTKLGPGKLLIGGLIDANTYAGTTTIAEGLLEAIRRARSLSSNIVVTGPTATLRTGRATGNQFTSAHTVLPAGANVTVENGGLWAMNGTNSETLGRLSGDGRVDIGPGGTLTISNEVSFDFAGTLSGPGALNKLGLATLRMTGDSPSYVGLATVIDGTYKIDGSVVNGPITVKVGATLRGIGAAGDVTVENGGVLKVDSAVPSRLGGEFTVHSANFQNGGVLGLGLYGPHPSGGNDRLIVGGAVTLNSPTLSSGFQYPPQEGDVIPLITCTGASAVSGTLGGFPDGALRTLGGIPVVISYAGGDGNDVTLTVTNFAARGGGASLATSDGGPLGPDDCSQLWLAVTNRGAAVLTGVRGRLRSLTSGVLVTRAESAFPDLAPNARGTNVEPFQIRTDSRFPCGSSAAFELVLTASGQAPITIAYSLPGASGSGLAFDGRNDLVQLPVNAYPGVSNNFTIELWANPAATRAESAETTTGASGVNAAQRQLQRFAVFPDRGDLAYGPTHTSAGLSIGRNGVSAYEHGTNATQGTLHLPSRLVYSNSISGWTHVALVYTNRRPRLYVNGKLERSSSTQSLFPFVHASGSLGGSGQNSFGNFDGQLDEVRIWNTALTAEQIQTNMLRSLTGAEPNLVTYFRCDAGSGAVLADSAPASPNPTGTLINGAAFVMPGVVPFGPPCNSRGGACESCFVVAGQFGAGAVESSRRLRATGLPSVCDPPKSCPDFEESPDDPVRHVVHSFTNSTAAEVCITAQLHPDCPGQSVSTFGVAAYLGEFRVNQPCSFYLGDDGHFDSSPPLFSFRVPPRTNFVVVVTALRTNLPCDTYALELFGLPCPPPVLQIARDNAPNKVRLQWSSAYPDYWLQSIPSLNGAAPFPFNNVTNPPTLIGGRFAVTNVVDSPQRLFRLSK